MVHDSEVVSSDGQMERFDTFNFHSLHFYIFGSTSHSERLQCTVEQLCFLLDVLPTTLRRYPWGGVGSELSHTPERLILNDSGPLNAIER